MNFIVRNIIFSLLVISTVKCEVGKENDLREGRNISKTVIKWFKNIVNPKYGKSNNIESEDLENKRTFQDLPPIFTSAESCDDPGARWDYKFTGAEKKKKLKPGVA